MNFKIKLTVIICLGLSIAGYAQLSEKDSIITSNIYTDKFAPANEITENWLSSTLKGKTLSDLIENNVISRDDMRDLALPLGVFKNQEPVNFLKGMIDMWKMKAGRIKRGKKRVDQNIMWLSIKAIETNLKPNHQTTLRKYREELISPAIANMKTQHKEIKKLYSAERAKFMDMVAENLSSNMLLGFNIQELLPPTHLLKDGKTIKPINPIFKAWFFDRLLQEAGTEFIHYYPARYDRINSYGPFQMTGMAVADLQANGRLTTGFKKYKSMNDLKTIDDHLIVAALFAYNNWERLSTSVSLDGNLKKFNDYFKGYKTDNKKKKKLRIFISGITACMHHDPVRTRKMVKNYLKANKTLDKIHYECVEKYGNKQLRKYYRSSVEAYLIMKVYDKLFP